MGLRSLLLCLLVLLNACGGSGSSTSPNSIAQTTEPQDPVASSRFDLAIPQPLPLNTSDVVSITTQDYRFEHWAYSLNPDFSLAWVDYTQRDSTTYQETVIENNYLKLSLIPEFGGRILSILNKSTGHEALYRNPMGSPYLNGFGAFYYDWLMIMGGIAPTFPESEHGKAWLRPWQLEVVTANNAIATVRMSFRDDDGFNGRPGQFNNGITGLTCIMEATLKAGRAAVDVVVSIQNPNDQAKTYEYWTLTTLAPGSDPNNIKATDGLEIIGDINRTVPGYGIVNGGAAQWSDVQFFRNHNGEGIAYPVPDMSHTNVWGAINHDNEEGFFRIADNTVTPGLKIWTFGRDNTQDLDPFGETGDDSNWHRPAIELWAGVSRQFFQDANLAANTQLVFSETYAPSVGLNDVHYASDDVLISVSDTEIGLNFLTPDQQYRVTINRGDESLFSATLKPDMVSGNFIVGDFSGAIAMTIQDQSGDIVFEGQF